MPQKKRSRGQSWRDKVSLTEFEEVPNPPSVRGHGPATHRRKNLRWHAEYVRQMTSAFLTEVQSIPITFGSAIIRVCGYCHRPNAVGHTTHCLVPKLEHELNLWDTRLIPKHGSENGASTEGADPEEPQAGDQSRTRSDSR